MATIDARAMTVLSRSKNARRWAGAGIATTVEAFRLATPPVYRSPTDASALGSPLRRPPVAAPPPPEAAHGHRLLVHQGRRRLPPSSPPSSCARRSPAGRAFRHRRPRRSTSPAPSARAGRGSAGLARARPTAPRAWPTGWPEPPDVPPDGLVAARGPGRARLAGRAPG